MTIIVVVISVVVVLSTIMMLACLKVASDADDESERIMAEREKNAK